MSLLTVRTTFTTSPMLNDVASAHCCPEAVVLRTRNRFEIDSPLISDASIVVIGWIELQYTAPYAGVFEILSTVMSRLRAGVSGSDERKYPVIFSKWSGSIIRPSTRTTHFEVSEAVHFVPVVRIEAIASVVASAVPQFWRLFSMISH